VDFISNIVPVRKKNGQVRVCVDFRDLNAACLKDDFPLPISELIIDGNSGFFSHLIHGQKFWVKSNAPGRRRATAKITQKGAKEGECWFSGCACVGPGGPGSSRIKSSRSPGTMVDWCEEEYSSEEELDSDEAPLLEYPRRTRQKKDEAALERGLLVLHKLLIQFHL